MAVAPRTQGIVRVTKHQASDLEPSRFTPLNFFLVRFESIGTRFGTFFQLDSDGFDPVPTFERSLETVVERTSDEDPFLVVGDSRNEEIDHG